VIFRAEIGDFLYIIIFAILMLLGGLEKVMKAKRQQNMPPPPPQPYDEFEDLEEQPDQGQAPPQSIEEMMRRMMQTIEAPDQEEEKVINQPQTAQSLEELPSAGRYFHHPEEIKKREQYGRVTYQSVIPPIEEKIEITDVPEYYFDIRQAVIASEILNRKY